MAKRANFTVETAKRLVALLNVEPVRVIKKIGGLTVGEAKENNDSEEIWLGEIFSELGDGFYEVDEIFREDDDTFTKNPFIDDTTSIGEQWRDADGFKVYEINGKTGLMDSLENKAIIVQQMQDKAGNDFYFFNAGGGGGGTPSVTPKFTAYFGGSSSYSADFDTVSVDLGPAVPPPDPAVDLPAVYPLPLYFTAGNIINNSGTYEITTATLGGHNFGTDEESQAPVAVEPSIETIEAIVNAGETGYLWMKVTNAWSASATATIQPVTTTAPDLTAAGDNQLWAILATVTATASTYADGRASVEFDITQVQDGDIDLITAMVKVIPGARIDDYNYTGDVLDNPLSITPTQTNQDLVTLRPFYGSLSAIPMWAQRIEVNGAVKYSFIAPVFS